MLNDMCLHCSTLKIAGHTLPYEDPAEMKERLSEIAPHLITQGDIQPANFYALAYKLMKVIQAALLWYHQHCYDNPSLTAVPAGQTSTHTTVSGAELPWGLLHDWHHQQSISNNGQVCQCSEGRQACPAIATHTNTQWTTHPQTIMYYCCYLWPFSML